MNVESTYSSRATSSAQMWSQQQHRLRDVGYVYAAACGPDSTQDPLNPTDGTEYVSQLAQLTQVQSMETVSQPMANNAVLMDNLQTLATGNLVASTSAGRPTRSRAMVKRRLMVA